RRAPPNRATRAATATNPTQSPSEETSMARHSREKDGWTRRSLRVALLVPRRAAISSPTLPTSVELYRGSPKDQAERRARERDAPPRVPLALRAPPARRGFGTSALAASSGSSVPSESHARPQLVHRLAPPLAATTSP